MAGETVRSIAVVGMALGASRRQLERDALASGVLAARKDALHDVWRSDEHQHARWNNSWPGVGLVPEVQCVVDKPRPGETRSSGYYNADAPMGIARLVFVPCGVLIVMLMGGGGRENDETTIRLSTLADVKSHFIGEEARQ